MEFNKDFFNQYLKYNEYLNRHRAQVLLAYLSLVEVSTKVNDITMLYLLKEVNLDDILSHDRSKYKESEFKAYCNYFYGTKDDHTKKQFDYAWLNHIHDNEHHWQHYVLINDDDGTKALDMPIKYIIEMVCDWLSFSINSENLDEIQKWYDSHKNQMILSPKTKETTEYILNFIKENKVAFELCLE